jgi:hypothetical protein
MLQDLLKQQGIEARLDGAQLQGGVGELPASGFVRLVVNDEDFAAARAVVDDWESASAQDPIPIPAPARALSKGVLGALIGLVVGVAATAAFFRAPLPAEGIDHDGDGSLDERWFTAASGTPVRTEMDRNFDGRTDWIYRFDRKGRLESAEGDDDFDGSFETTWQYSRGNPAYGEVDADGDSAPDFAMRLNRGVLASTEYYDPATSRPVRREYFELGRITTADVDTDRDGDFDTRHVYSPLAEIIESTPIAPP